MYTLYNERIREVVYNTIIVIRTKGCYLLNQSHYGTLLLHRYLLYKKLATYFVSVYV
jgi:hypothetical protein